MNLYLDLVNIFKPCEFVGLSLITLKESEEHAKVTIKQYFEKYGVPAADLVRFGGGPIIDNIIHKLT